jgi:hypothetical protein
MTILARAVIENNNLSVDGDGNIRCDGQRLAFPEVAIEIMALGALKDEDRMLWDSERTPTLIAQIRYQCGYKPLMLTR